MGRQIKGLLYFNFTDARYPLTIFWTILMGILVISLTIAYMIKNIEGSFMTFSLTGPMYVYCSILGFLTLKVSIPFSLKRGATRKNILICLVTFFICFSIDMSIVRSSSQVIIIFLVQ